MRKILDDKMKEQIVRRYIDLDQSESVISTIMKIGKARVAQILKDFGVKKKAQGKAWR